MKSKAFHKTKKWRPTGRLPILVVVNVILLVMVVGVASLYFAQAATWVGEHGEIENDQLYRINAARAAAGVQPVTLVHIDCVHSLARNWSNHMSATQALLHDPNIGAQLNPACGGAWSRAGENIGVGGDSAVIFNAFMNSIHHKENILSPLYTRVGIGAVVDGNGKVWITQKFANCSNCSGGWNTQANVPLPKARRIFVGTNGKGYVLDSWGGVWPLNGAPASATAGWPNWDIARAMTVKPDASGLEFLDGFGGVHPLGNAPSLNSPGYWNWDIARDITVTDWNTGSGIKLDGWGGLSKFGPNPPNTAGAGYWPNWDIAKRVVGATGGGYVLDGWGGVHAFGTAKKVVNGPYWQGWDIARDLEISPDGTKGYVLDGFGGINPLTIQGYPATPKIPGAPYFGWDVAVDMVITDWTNLKGYTLDARGGVHAFGGAPAVTGAPYW